MSRLRGKWGLVVALLTLLVGGYVVGSGRFTKSRAQLVADVDSASRSLATIRGQMRKAAAIEEQLRAIQDRTLGGSLETADSALRARLNRIGEELQLTNLTVSTGPTSAHRSPARSRYRQRELREEPDFDELRGSIIGEGTLEQALRLLHRVQAEPWPKHITEFRLDPRENGARVGVTVRLATIFLRDRAPAPGNWLAYDPDTFAPYLLLATANPFRVPPPPASIPKPTAVATGPAPGFAYEQWALTIVAQGPAGPEVSLLNRQSNESRLLMIGERLADARLISAEGDQARFEIGSDQFVIQVGQTLRDGSPAPR
jgi:hypothetical protein